MPLWWLSPFACLPIFELCNIGHTPCRGAFLVVTAILFSMTSDFPKMDQLVLPFGKC
jgi:hypothetical protein